MEPLSLFLVIVGALVACMVLSVLGSLFLGACATAVWLWSQGL
jgi:hypothetical protein